ncbi:MAG: hypothetical protein H7234_05730 [Herminiimonas sp.]|nr:hypothetical protein [Herminiimonas sp.]
MNETDLLTALAALRGAIATEIRAKKGAGGTLPLASDNPFVAAAARIGWQTGAPPTIYTLLKSIEFAHAQITIETFRDGASETAAHMLAAIASETGDSDRQVKH